MLLEASSQRAYSGVERHQCNRLQRPGGLLPGEDLAYPRLQMSRHRLQCGEVCQQVRVQDRRELPHRPATADNLHRGSQHPLSQDRRCRVRGRRRLGGGRHRLGGARHRRRQEVRQPAQHRPVQQVRTWLSDARGQRTLLVLDHVGWTQSIDGGAEDAVGMVRSGGWDRGHRIGGGATIRCREVCKICRSVVLGLEKLVQPVDNLPTAVCAAGPIRSTPPLPRWPR
jgi:hypothetical protein